MVQCLDFVAFICLFLAAKTTAEQILPPQNLTLRWINEFTPEFTWKPPPHSMANCHYDGKMEKNHKVTNKYESIDGKSTSFSEGNLFINGELQSYSLETVCHGNRSKPAFLNISRPALVKSLECYLTSSKRGHCSWTPNPGTLELCFFYQLDDSMSDEPSTERLQECSSYSYTDGVKSGCDLNTTVHMTIRMLINATMNNKVVWNTFFHDVIKVKPPALEWTVEESKSQFTISWTPPDVLALDSWRFNINYVECEKENTLVASGQTHMLYRAPSCPYCIWIQATSKFGISPPTDKKCYGRYWGLLPVYVVIAVLLAILAVIFITCLLRNKKYIFPKIPVPSNIFKDIMENNSENFFRKLYIPPEEQENCTVTVVKDAQTIKPDCSSAVSANFL